MKYLAIIAATLAVVCTNTLAQDYCAADICDPGLTHIDCGNSGQFANACPLSARIVSPNKQLLLQLVNTRRNRVAGGGLSGFPAATRMPKVVWSTDMQRLAELSLKRCVLATDQCRNTFTFKKIGQLMFYESKTGANLNYRDHLIRAIQTWFTTFVYADAAKMASYQKTTPNYGPFAQLVNQRVTHMGCGSITYKKNRNNVQANLICNFASRNTPNSVIYKAGVAVTECVSGPDVEFKNLCSTQEEVDPNAE